MPPLYLYKNAIMKFMWLFHVASINKNRQNINSIKLPSEAYSRSFANKGQMVTKQQSDQHNRNYTTCL